MFLYTIFHEFREIVMARFPHGLLCFVAGNCINAAYNVKKRAAGGGDPFWFVSMLLVILNGYGGGFLAPILIGKPVIPAVFDPIVPLCILAWYFNHIIPKGQDFLDWMPVKLAWTTLLALFRTCTACNIIEKAVSVLEPGPYYPSTPLIGPIMVGATLGCAGLFLPFDKGLKVIENGIPWQIQGAIMGSTFYHLCIHDKTGFLGVNLRFAILKVILAPLNLASVFDPSISTDTITEEFIFTKDNVRCMIATMHLTQLLGIVILNDPNFNIFSRFHKILYFITRIPPPSSKVVKVVENSANISIINSVNSSSSNPIIDSAGNSSLMIKQLNQMGSTINNRIITNTNSNDAKNGFGVRNRNKNKSHSKSAE